MKQFIKYEKKYINTQNIDFLCEENVSIKEIEIGNMKNIYHDLNYFAGEFIFKINLVKKNFIRKFIDFDKIYNENYYNFDEFIKDKELSQKYSHFQQYHTEKENILIDEIFSKHYNKWFHESYEEYKDIFCRYTSNEDVKKLTDSKFIIIKYKNQNEEILTFKNQYNYREFIEQL